MTQREPTLETPLLDLLSERATAGLDAASHTALREEASRASVSDLGADGALGFALAAAAADLAWGAASPGTEHLPAPLRVRIVEAGGAEVARLRAPSRSPAGSTPGPRWLAWSGMAAAMLLLGFLLTQAFTGVGVRPTPAERVAMLEARDDTLVLAWKGLDQPGFERVTGDVVWNDTRQEGYMRLRGLPVNDAGEAQYQLWIVDPARDKHPVDGGVFDARSEGEILVPIRAALRVDRPAAFVLTLEQPGGVVVSDGPHLVLAARG